VVVKSLFGLGMMLFSLMIMMMMLDLPKPNSEIDSRLLVSIALIILLRELTVRVAKQTAASHRTESLSRLIVAFLSSHQCCQSWHSFWGGQFSQSVLLPRGKVAANSRSYGWLMIGRVSKFCV